MRTSPACTNCPPKRFTPLLFALLSLPFCVEPPAFLCAIAITLYGHLACAQENLRQNVRAGWSRPVAREAHNLEVAGSNPAPATIIREALNHSLSQFLRLARVEEVQFPVLEDGHLAEEIEVPFLPFLLRRSVHCVRGRFGGGLREDQRFFARFQEPEILLCVLVLELRGPEVL